MPGLARLLSADDAHLVSHRPERRAVVRLGAGDEPAFAKVVPGRRLAALAVTARRTAALPLRTPAVLHVDEAHHAVLTAAVPGRPLRAWLSEGRAAEACMAVGMALARLHRLTPEGLPEHGPAEEEEVSRRWESWVTTWRTEVRSAGVGGSAPSVANLPAMAAAAPPPPPPRPSLVHRDFHDGQLLVDDDLEVGIIDFDLMAAGDPALDVANFVCHLQLREQQGLARAEPLVEAFLRGYEPDDRVRAALPFYLATTRRRLAAVYAFRDASLPS